MFPSAWKASAMIVVLGLLLLLIAAGGAVAGYIAAPAPDRTADLNRLETS
jgi:hypothetical protein